MPTPYEAAQILSRRFGLGVPTQGQMGEGDVLELAKLREQRQSELEDRVRLGDPVAQAQLEGPGGVNQDINNDPSTGLAAQKETAANVAAQHASSMKGFATPQEEAAYGRTQAAANAPAALEVLKGKIAQDQAAKNFAALRNLIQPATKQSTAPPTSPVSTAAPAPMNGPATPSPDVNPVLTAAQRIEAQAPQAHFKLNVDAQGRPSVAQEPTQKLSAAGTQTVDSLAQAYDITKKARTLLTELGADQNAAAQRADAQKGLSGVPGQLANIGIAKLKRMFYGMGGVQADPRRDKVIAQMEQAKVLASRGLLGGMRNWAWIQQIQDHLQQGQLPDAANLERMDNFLETAPSLVEDVYRTEFGHDPIPESAPPEVVPPGYMDATGTVR